MIPADCVAEQCRGYLRGVNWVWFDLDDTLMDFRANSLAALRMTYEECGLDRYFPTCDQWTECYQKYNHALWDRYNKAEISQDYLRLHRFLDPINECSTVSESEFAVQARHMDTLYLSLLAGQKVMVPGAMDLVGYLRAHAYNIGILSNGFCDVQHRKLHAVGLDVLVDAVVLSDVPADATAVGIPAQIVRIAGRSTRYVDEVDQTSVKSPTLERLAALSDRVETLEKLLDQCHIEGRRGKGSCAVCTKEDDT